jgi:hypothetical protein
MIPIEEIGIYLPKYLSPDSERKLFRDLDGFPDNIDERMYSDFLLAEGAIFQGDGIRDLPFVSLPDNQVRHVSCMILSNTCDVDPNNPRFLPSSICYARIVTIESYKQILKEEGIEEKRIENHVRAIKAQKITGIFYLPRGSRLKKDSLVFLDRLCHSPSESIDPKSVPDRRLFVLSNYGAYLFLFKLSIHFTRIADKVDRSSV